MSNRVPESEFTPWGGSFTCWNGKSPECEFVEFVAAFARVLRPRLVIETGTGQGFVTRSVVAACPKVCRYFAVEHDAHFRDSFVCDDQRITRAARVPANELPNADLLLLDSTTGRRIKECESWLASGKRGSVCIVHDVSNRHRADQIHSRLYRYVTQIGSGVSVVLLRNPRGGAMLTKL